MMGLMVKFSLLSLIGFFSIFCSTLFCDFQTYAFAQEQLEVILDSPDVPQFDQKSKNQNTDDEFDQAMEMDQTPQQSLVRSPEDEQSLAPSISDPQLSRSGVSPFEEPASKPNIDRSFQPTPSPSFEEAAAPPSTKNDLASWRQRYYKKHHILIPIVGEKKYIKSDSSRHIAKHFKKSHKHKRLVAKKKSKKFDARKFAKTSKKHKMKIAAHKLPPKKAKVASNRTKAPIRYAASK